MHKKSPPTLIEDTLERLSVLPQRIDDLKRASARVDTLTALSRATPWKADLDPKDLANGCPSVKEDRTPFSADDFAEIARAMRPLASKLADETSLSTYQAAYDAANKKIGAPVHQPTNLIPPIHKHTFAPDIDPSTLIDDDFVFKSLTGINWASSDFQPTGEEEGDELVQDDSESSTRQGQDH